MRMPTTTKELVDEGRWRAVAATMRRHGHRPDALIETLHTLQEAYGYLQPEALRRVAEALRVPLSRVYGVATFYHHFTLRPPGKHTCTVCLGTACYIEGGPGLLHAAEQVCVPPNGETISHDTVTVQVVRCIGACSQGPLALVDGELLGHATPERLEARLKEWTQGEP